MKLEQSFEVAAPLDTVWEALIDVARVAPCLPGATITGRNDDGTYNGTFTIKIGPTTAAYTGKLEMEQVDEESHTATMRAQGTDKRGQGGAKATIVSKVTSAGDGQTRVEVDTDYSITGRLARFGRGGMIEDISERLLKEFASRLQSSLSQPEGASVAASAEGGAAGSAGGESASAGDEGGSAGDEGGSAGDEGASVGDDKASAADEEGETAPEPPAASASAAQTTPLPVDEAAPLDATSLVGGVIADRIKSNPLPLLLALLAFLLLRRRRRRRRWG